MAPGTTSRRLWEQSTSQLAVNTGNNSSVVACKRKRGKVVNNKVIDYKAITGQKPRIEIHPKYARPVRRWSSQFVREVGLVARQHGPLTSHDWSKVEDDVRGPLRDRIIDKFDIDMHLPHVKYVVDKILGERLRGFRCILNLHYMKFENDGVARRHPYDGLAQEKWDVCCDWFGREEFKDDSETQQPLGMIELYRRTHLSSKGWTSLVAEENYLKDESEAEGVVPKIEDEILNTVLGARSGYSKGLGHGVLPQSSKRVSSIQLEEEVQRRRDEEEF
ncbi:hypothetical protein GIB67_015445 [Kingdonia uniflora]|uniref:Transposase n=1 Tax=Kingdonia uniflora TaxID=39325 RepID=A0A7J7KZ63_9MAGN|nr:hypothetical protein GIB67_015445 [Kingdonia uniflora]